MIPKNTVIAFLILTAVMLSCTWALIDSTFVSSGPTGVISRAGFYIITTTSGGGNEPDLLWVANINTQRLVIYGTSTEGVITPLASADLLQVFQGQYIPEMQGTPLFPAVPQFPELPQYPGYP